VAEDTSPEPRRQSCDRPLVFPSLPARLFRDVIGVDADAIFAPDEYEGESWSASRRLTDPVTGESQVSLVSVKGAVLRHQHRHLFFGLLKACEKLGNTVEEFREGPVKLEVHDRGLIDFIYGRYSGQAFRSFCLGLRDLVDATVVIESLTFRWAFHLVDDYSFLEAVGGRNVSIGFSLNPRPHASERRAAEGGHHGS